MVVAVGCELQILQRQSSLLVLEGCEELLHRCHDRLNRWLAEGLPHTQLEEVGSAGGAYEEGVVREEETMQSLVHLLIVCDQSREDEAMSLDVIEDFEERFEQPFGGVMMRGVDDAAPVVGHSTTEDDHVGDLILPHIGPPIDADGERMRATVRPGCFEHLLSQRLSEKGLMALQHTTVAERDVGVAVGVEGSDALREINHMMSNASAGEEGSDGRHESTVVDRGEGGVEVGLIVGLASLRWRREDGGRG